MNRLGSSLQGFYLSWSSDGSKLFSIWSSPNDDKQNYPICRLNLLVVKFGHFQLWVHLGKCNKGTQSFYILVECCVMGNSLSTWHLTIQSAVDGENFNYNPDYNQVNYLLFQYGFQKPIRKRRNSIIVTRMSILNLLNFLLF